MIFENLRIATAAVRANTLRSFLTVLGIVIGVASVIAVVSLIHGMRRSLTSELQGLGATYLFVLPDSPPRRFNTAAKLPDLTEADGRDIVRNVAAIEQYTPVFFRGSEVRYRDEVHNAVVLGVEPSYLEVNNHWVDRGRFLTEEDARLRRRICIVGSSIAERLGMDDALRKGIQVGGVPFLIVGVMEPKGRMFSRDYDNVVLIPYLTAAAVYGPDAVKSIQLDFRVRDVTLLDSAAAEMESILRHRHRVAAGQPGDFKITKQKELLETVSNALTTTTVIMSGIVSIALLVGGVGIMNIMLVSVTERTREIGVRKAVGARPRDIMVQFLIESMILALAGGVVGVGFGYVIAQVARRIVTQWIEFPSAGTPLWSIVLAFGFCTAIGVVFGTYPAAKASRLNAIDALRYE